MSSKRRPQSKGDKLGRSELNPEQQTKEGDPWRRMVDDWCFHSKRLTA